MKRTYRIWSWIWLLVVAVACQQEDIAEPPLSVDQQSLIGRAINFDASYAQPFATKTTYDNTGVFNEGDRMRIYRQYYKPEQHGFDEQTEAFRTYSYVSRVATGTSIVLGKSWKVEVGKQGSNGRENGVAVTFIQAEKDSLTWESGQTVRFRAWALSNLSGCINTSSWDGYYPDFSVSEWVTASGPTMQVPLTLKHIGCRLHFTRKGGNQIYKIEFATEKEDYKYEDNAGSSVEDENDKEKDAADCAQRVSMAYHQLCWPGGVSFDGGLLALPKMTETTSFQPKQIDEYFGEMIPFGTRSADDIREEAERPRFNNLNEDFYLIAIPYDMSTTGGQPITLPACTRFRIYLRDVNNGDDKNTSGYEGAYHLFCLKDIKDENGKCPFAEGLTLKGGYSYEFTVGYYYNKLSVTTTSDFSWNEQTVPVGTAEDQTATAPEGTKLAWWKKGLDDAIAEALAPSMGDRKPYEPQFVLKTVADVREFIALVNGTAATKTTGLARARRSVPNEENTKSYYWWYRTPMDTADTTWVKNSEAEAEGYVFYNKYVPSNGDVPAYSIEELLTAPYSFFDNSVQKRLKVTIAEDIDFNDLPMEGMSKPFSGYLDGGMHLLSNLNLNLSGGTLFASLEKAAVTNLRINTLHPFGLVRTAQESVLAGLSIQASPCRSLAQEMKGACYVVGCIVQGEKGQALVGKADNLTLMGCMQTMSGLDAGGALLAAYADGASEFFAPQTGEKVGWGRLMCCYYDISRSPQAVAVGGKSYSYNKPQQYVRALTTSYLCARYDHLLADKSYYDKLSSASEKMYYYGIAPWKAMNSAIYYYNHYISIGKLYPCNAHYAVDETCYTNRYPQLVSGASTDYVDVTQQNN